MVRAVFVRPGGRLEYRSVSAARRSIRLHFPVENYELIGRVKGSAPRPVLAVYALEGSGYGLLRYTRRISVEMLADPGCRDACLSEFGRALDVLPIDRDPRTAIGIAVRVLYETDWPAFALEVWTVARSIEHVIVHGIPGGSKPAGLMSGRAVSRGGGR